MIYVEQLNQSQLDDPSGARNNALWQAEAEACLATPVALRPTTPIPATSIEVCLKTPRQYSTVNALRPAKRDDQIQFDTAQANDRNAYIHLWHPDTPCVDFAACELVAYDLASDNFVSNYYFGANDSGSKCLLATDWVASSLMAINPLNHASIAYDSIARNSTPCDVAQIDAGRSDVARGDTTRGDAATSSCDESVIASSRDRRDFLTSLGATFKRSRLVRSHASCRHRDVWSRHQDAWRLRLRAVLERTALKFEPGPSFLLHNYNNLHNLSAPGALPRVDAGPLRDTSLTISQVRSGNAAPDQAAGVMRQAKCRAVAKVGGLMLKPTKRHPYHNRNMRRDRADGVWCAVAQPIENRRSTAQRGIAQIDVVPQHPALSHAVLRKMASNWALCKVALAEGLARSGIYNIIGPQRSKAYWSLPLRLRHRDAASERVGTPSSMQYSLSCRWPVLTRHQAAPGHYHWSHKSATHVNPRPGKSRCVCLPKGANLRNVTVQRIVSVLKRNSTAKRPTSLRSGVVPRSFTIAKWLATSSYAASNDGAGPGHTAARCPRTERFFGALWPTPKSWLTLNFLLTQSWCKRSTVGCTRHSVMLRRLWPGSGPAQRGSRQHFSSTSIRLVVNRGYGSTPVSRAWCRVMLAAFECVAFTAGGDVAPMAVSRLFSR